VVSWAGSKGLLMSSRSVHLPGFGSSHEGLMFQVGKKQRVSSPRVCVVVMRHGSHIYILERQERRVSIVMAWI
jgi:hypothetical protein